MNKTIVALALTALMGGAMASPGNDGCVGNCPQGGGGGSASALARATARASASQLQSQALISRQANSQTFSYTESDRGNTYEDYTPNAVAPSIDPTVPCAIPVSMGVGVPGLAASGGTAYIDEGCEQRELIRIGLTSGNAAAEGKAAQLLNRQLDEALAERAPESDETVASWSSSGGIWEWQGN